MSLAEYISGFHGYDLMLTMPTSSHGSRRDFAALEARRFRAAELFARGESQAAVARALGVTTAAANHWYQAWQAKGRKGLKVPGVRAADRASGRPTWRSSTTRCGRGRRRTASRPRCGPCRASRGYSSASPAWAITRAMSGACCGPWGGRSNAPAGKRASATRRPLRGGRARDGRS